jgi:hypothetical protein
VCDGTGSEKAGTYVGLQYDTSVLQNCFYVLFAICSVTVTKVDVGSKEVAANTLEYGHVVPIDECEGHPLD